MTLPKASSDMHCHSRGAHRQANVGSSLVWGSVAEVVVGLALAVVLLRLLRGGVQGRGAQQQKMARSTASR